MGDPFRPETVKARRGLAAAGAGVAERLAQRSGLRGAQEDVSRATLAVADVGVWDWDIARGWLVWDRRSAELHGVGPEDFDGTMEAVFAAAHPDDAPTLRAAVEAAVRAGGSFVEEYRVVRPDGSQAWVQGRGAVVSSSVAGATRMAGVFADMKRLSTIYDIFGRIIEQGTDSLVVLDAADRVVLVNVAAARLLGRASLDLVGRPGWDSLPPAPGGGSLRDAYQRAVEAETPLEVEISGAWFEVRMFPTPDLLTVVLTNVDERHRADAERAGLISSLSQALARSRQLLRATSALGPVLTVQDVADVAFRAAAADLEINCGGFVLFEDAEPGRIMTWPQLPPPLLAIWQRMPNPGPAATVEILLTGQPRFDPTRQSYLTDYPDRRELFDTVGMDGSTILPLIVSGRPIGVILLGWPGPRPFDEEERAFLRTLAGVYAQAIERARLHERQMSVVETLQRAILPPALPELPGMELVARYLPAGLDVGIGGDWYDAAVLPDGSVTLVVGDVGGHGLPAVATMAELRHAARAYALEGHPPAAITTQLSANLDNGPDATLATAIVANLDPATRHLTWSSAGHPPPLFLTGSAAVYLDDLHGPILGVDPTCCYGQSELDLPPGARLFLYSDGLVERRDISITDRLDTLAATAASAASAASAADATDNPCRRLDDLCDRVLAEMAGPTNREDDLCLLAIHTP